MKVLIACEYSGTVRGAFIARGHYATSCDLLPTEVPGPHYKGDVFDIIGDGWDLMIAHPPCTYLTNSAEWAYKDPDYVRYPNVGYHQKLNPATLRGEDRRKAREEAVRFFLALWNAKIPRVCIENPVGHMASRLKANRQTIHPHQFGDDASKATTLWVRGLPPLYSTKHIAPRFVDGKPRWGNQTDGGQNKLGPSEDRWKIRSVTYQGIANAMAEQWGALKA
jgi:hypothetical protein